MCTDLLNAFGGEKNIKLMTGATEVKRVRCNGSKRCGIVIFNQGYDVLILDPDPDSPSSFWILLYYLKPSPFTFLPEPISIELDYSLVEKSVKTNFSKDLSAIPRLFTGMTGHAIFFD